MPTNAHVINVSAMGPLEQIEPVIDFVSHQPHLVAYSGMAIRDKGSRGSMFITAKDQRPMV